MESNTLESNSISLLNTSCYFYDYGFISPSRTRLYTYWNRTPYALDANCSNSYAHGLYKSRPKKLSVVWIIMG